MQTKHVAQGKWYFEVSKPPTPEAERLWRITKAHDVHFLTNGPYVGDCVGNSEGKRWVDTKGEVCSCCGYKVEE